jgi:tetratricopeptide (TPR) repeat protein
VANTTAKQIRRLPARISAPASTPLVRRLRSGWLICLLLTALTIGVFFPVRSFDFVNYDDSDYVTGNNHVLSGLSVANLKWACESGHASNWHPLTWLSHQTDCQLFGTRPGPMHIMNLALHALNAALLFLILRRMTGAHWKSALVSGLFAVHPLRAESVAWISERKDVLSGLFFLLTLGAYARYVQSQGTSRSKSAGAWYALSLLCFGLGLMSKPMLVTTPFLLLLLDHWPLGRWTRVTGTLATKLVLEKVPFLLLAVASSIVTFLVQRKGGAVSTVLSLTDRVENAFVSYVRYVGKTIWPTNLSVLYPHPGYWPLWEVLGAVLLILTITVLVVQQIRRRPWLFIGWFWFLGTLIPVIGLIQVGVQSMADRYTYIPGVGLLIMIVWGVGEWIGARESMIWPITAGSLLAVGSCAAVCFHQIQFWRESQLLFQRAIDVTSNNYLAYNNLGYYLSGKGQPEQAKKYYLKSLGINPGYPDALNNFGFALAAEGRYAEAIPYYEAALRVSRNQPDIHNNLGNAFSETGHLKEALDEYGLALQINPEHAEANNNLGIALAMQGNLDQAIGHFRLALRTRPNYASAHSNLGNALAAQHKIEGAIREYQSCLRLNPKDPQAHNNLGNVLMEEGRVDQAIGEYIQALQVNPKNPEAHFNLAVAYLRTNRSTEAIAHLQQVLRLSPGNAEAKRQLELLAH